MEKYGYILGLLFLGVIVLLATYIGSYFGNYLILNFIISILLFILYIFIIGRLGYIYNFFKFKGKNIIIVKIFDYSGNEKIIELCVFVKRLFLKVDIFINGNKLNEKVYILKENKINNIYSKKRKFVFDRYDFLFERLKLKSNIIEIISSEDNPFTIGTRKVRVYYFDNPYQQTKIISGEDFTFDILNNELNIIFYRKIG